MDIIGWSLDHPWQFLIAMRRTEYVARNPDELRALIAASERGVEDVA